jgi:GH15 family glucan-1,4-alpha-glucosidase
MADRSGYLPISEHGLIGDLHTVALVGTNGALTRAGRLEEARLAFEKMLTYANHLGLYAEQISVTGEQQGNFPQALTHLALISAAFNLDRALG